MKTKVSTEIERSIGGKRIVLACVFIGSDVHVICYGGDKAHEGAISLAAPYKNDKGTLSASVSTLTAPGHRDDAISRALAEHFSKALGCVATAVCGIHFEKATPDLIKTIQDTVSAMADELLITVRNRGTNA